jgi:hypothetical protein
MADASSSQGKIGLFYSLFHQIGLLGNVVFPGKI